MEVELREQLWASDHGLWIVWHVYDLDKHSENFERAGNAVHWQIRDGLMQMLYKSKGEQRVLKDWEIKQVLAEETNWHKADTESVYFLHLTDEGEELM